MSFRVILKEPGLPSYAQMMADYHQAFALELKDVVGSLAIKKGERVVDLACGDGFYSRWLAEEVGAEGGVLALDVSGDFLAEARRYVGAAEVGARVAFVQADLDHLALDEGEADVVWCAQSLYSLPDPVDAVRRMRRLAKPGGRVAVFESDEFHHLILPWPIELEIAMRQAELKSYRAQSGDGEKFYVGRNLPGVFREAGLPDCRIQSFAFHRQTPIDDASRAYLVAYLDDMRRRIVHHLDDPNRDLFESLTDPGSSRFLLSDQDFGFTCLEHLATAKCPAH